MKLIITILLLSIMLSSCGVIILNTGEQPPIPETTTFTETETEPPEETTTESDETTGPNETSRKIRPVETADNKARADKYLKASTESARNFGGVAIYIATVDASTFITEDAANIVNAARIERNIAVEKIFNTKIIPIVTDFNNLYNQTLNSYKSGDFYTDIIAIPPESMGLFFASGLLLNLNLLPFTDYNAPYYDKEAMKQMSAGYGIYGMVGEFNKNIEYYYVLYFNRVLIEQLGLESPYDLVYENKWNMEKFREMTLATVDIDGMYGHGTILPTDNYIDMIYLSTGETLMDTGYLQTPVLRFATDRGKSVVEMMKNLINNDKTYYNGGGTLGVFYRGNILFYTDTVSQIFSVVDMKDTWGIVPFPKLDRTQKYNTYVDQALSVIAVPSNSSNVENIGAFLQAANAASYGYITDKYYAILQREVVRDSDTLNMLDYITGYNGKGKLAFDFAYMFGPEYTYYIGDRTYGALRNAVKGYGNLQSLYDTYYRSVNDYAAKLFPMNMG